MVTFLRCSCHAGFDGAGETNADGTFSCAANSRPIDVEQASMSLLLAYAAGLLNFMLIYPAPGYYSRQDTRTPVRCAGIIAVVSDMVFDAILHGSMAS